MCPADPVSRGEFSAVHLGKAFRKSWHQCCHFVGCQVLPLTWPPPWVLDCLLLPSYFPSSLSLSSPLLTWRCSHQPPFPFQRARILSRFLLVPQNLFCMLCFPSSPCFYVSFGFERWEGEDLVRVTRKHKLSPCSSSQLFSSVLLPYTTV